MNDIQTTINEIEDYVGGNIETTDIPDRMAFTVFLRRKLNAYARQSNLELIEGLKGKLAQNQKGQFEDDAGNICWYLDDLTKALNQEKKRLMEDVIGEAPKGHIPDEECCDQCDLRKTQRQRLKERL